MRYSIYNAIHKAQRQRLFELSIKIGRANFNDPAQAAEVKDDLKKMIAHLRKHSHTEETFIHPLFAKIDHTEHKLETEHHALEKLLNNLEENAPGNDGDKLYTEFNRLLAAYLQHIDAEEIAQSEILWKHFSDEELMEVSKRFQQSLSPQEVMENMKFMLPCLSAPEITNFLSNMKNKMPSPAFQLLCEIAEKAFSAAEWQDIKKAIEMTTN
jgi:hypothetical protein